MCYRNPFRVLALGWIPLALAGPAWAQPPAQTGLPASVRVFVPTAHANIWFDNVLTHQQGTCRLFASPPLEAGRTYSYTITAAWLEDGREVTDKKMVDVHPGRETVVRFLPGQGQGTQEAGDERPLLPPIAPEPGGSAPSDERPLLPPIAPEPSGSTTNLPPATAQ